ncbi:probable cytochrome P450 49a1 isoform X1 [Drosophila sechellia]|uniref:GM20522 n=1 Tax=Drosophila sechellia TaxID=7238 RepID=B4HMQ3_DROSE|nr:probable cytochrome P450 49a1 isoform X1 [Drosophila sechellia]XP_032570190.1 probable cytochrome P450 49a1 isoform X1 [Drosophila sechellia]XP_032570191.1 probable cytochrome P450 49a1 isoform X1 [Drosophila sechellia]XP_032570192.1 probable cytochrome P450 49a1 isoform X1 [Drosophila sechellia]EDW47265.1 GM20522 [Drosophila sechellia]
MSGLRKTSIALMRRSTSSTTILPHSGGGGGAVSPPSSGVGVATEIEKSIAMQRLRTGESAMPKKLNVSQQPVTSVATTRTTASALPAETTSSPAAAVRPYSDVPGPYPLPIIGNSWRFAPLIGTYKISDLDKVMNELHVNYGKMAKVGGLIGHPDLLFVFDGDEIRNIFKKEEAMPHRPSMPSLRHYKGDLRRDFFGDVAGLIGVHGPKWEAFRQEVQHILLQPQTAKKYIPPLNDIASEFMGRIELMRDEKDELPANFLHELYKWALESVGRVSLDTRLGCLSPEGSEEAQQIIEAINTFFWAVPELELRMPLWRIYPTKAYRSFVKALDQFTAICMKNIGKTMDKADADEARGLPKSEADISIVERIVRKTGNRKLAAILALDLFLVGVDTTSVAASSTIYQLAKNPDKQKKLFDELQKVFPHREADINQNILEQMPYLRACVKETLRMRPVVIANGRSLQSDAVINGYHVPKGTHVIFPHLVVSNDPAYFPEPKRFLPERWLKQSTDAAGCPHANQKIHPFVSLPFGFGRRMCVGRRFAEIELHTLLAKIFRKYKVSYNSGEFVYRVNSTYIPQSPLNFKLTLRDE